MVSCKGCGHEHPEWEGDLCWFCGTGSAPPPRRGVKPSSDPNVCNSAWSPDGRHDVENYTGYCRKCNQRVHRGA